MCCIICIILIILINLIACIKIIKFKYVETRIGLGWVDCHVGWRICRSSSLVYLGWQPDTGWYNMKIWTPVSDSEIIRNYQKLQYSFWSFLIILLMHFKILVHLHHHHHHDHHHHHYHHHLPNIINRLIPMIPMCWPVSFSEAVFSTAVSAGLARSSTWDGRRTNPPISLGIYHHDHDDHDDLYILYKLIYILYIFYTVTCGSIWCVMIVMCIPS